MPLFKDKDKADKTSANATLKVSTTTPTTTKKTAATPEEVFGKRLQANTKADVRADKIGVYRKPMAQSLDLIVLFADCGLDLLL